MPRGRPKKQKTAGARGGKTNPSKNLAIIEDAQGGKKILDLLIQGYSQHQIADKLGLTRGGVASYISGAAGVMTAEAMAIKEQIFVLNVMRMERLINMGFRHLEQTTDANGKMEDPRMFEALVRAVKTETDIATGPDAKQVNVDQHITLTITAGDELYKVAMENDRRNKPDVLAAKADDYEVIDIDDDRINRLSDIIEGIE